MKKKLLKGFILVLSLSILLGSKTYDSDKISYQQLSPEQEHQQISRLIVRLLTQKHYQKREINDSLSYEIFDRYIDRLDHSRIYFHESDIQSFEKYRYQLDDYLKKGDVDAAYTMFIVYQQRLAERLEYVFNRLKTEFDFTIDEYIEFDRETLPWSKTTAELDEIWRKRLKHDALNLKLSGKDWEGITSTLEKRYKRIQTNLSQFQSEDVFQIFMNALSESFDPHTSYFSPKSFDDFKIRMSQAFEGIGARLQTENEFTKVVEIVPGGPADKGKLLFPNDRIIGVAQGPDGELVDVVGWRLDDVVQLIRGKKGTTVQLQILSAERGANAAPETIAIVRDKVTLEDQSAKSEILEIEHGEKDFKFGVITIPTFYSDFEARRRGEKEYKSTSRDVRKLLDDLKQQLVDGIIIDLRNNGGGFLNESVELTGLFIEQGPVVQVRDRRGRVNVERDSDRELAYDGPLAVLMNRLSASASEIFSAAIQDYNRGIIIGSQSFGKGTVQNAIDLNRYVKNPSKKLGQLKLTVAKFYRIDGGSTQHVGVIPDISFPSRFNLMEIGENSRDNALLWDEIEPLQYDNLKAVSKVIPQLDRRSNLRLSRNEDFASLKENLAEYKDRREKTRVTLQEDKRKKEREKANKKKDSDSSKDVDSNKDKKKKDLLLNESAHILSDYIIISQN